MTVAIYILLVLVFIRVGTTNSKIDEIITLLKGRQP